MKPVICFEMLYEGLRPQEKIEKVADAGFEYVEFWGWRDKDIPAMIDVCRRRGAKVANFSGQRVGDLINPATHHKLVGDYRDAVEVALELGTNTVMVLTQELGDEGVVVHSYPDISHVDKRSAVISGLRKLLEHTPKGMHIVLESLNTVLDHKGYFFHDIATGVQILQEVNDPRVQILCDLYHQGMMGDDPINIIQKYLPHIGYIHVADVPGRHEPGTGRIAWREVLTTLKQNGYSGYVGFEYSPAADSDASLKTIRDLWESIT